MVKSFRISSRIGSYAGFKANRNSVGCRANVNSEQEK